VSYLQNLREACSREDVANLLGFTPSGLAYIVHKIPDEKKYTSFEIPKRSGGTRKIDAPIPELKALQLRLAKVLYVCRQEMQTDGYRPLAHAFERGRSIVTNASLHKRRRYVLNLDLKDFFPSLNFGRVRGFFIKDSYFSLHEDVATLIAQIACYANALPQGSPCSPIISNLVGHLLDTRLVRFAKKHKCTYSRYADDITFSTNQKEFPAALAAPVQGTTSQWEVGALLKAKIEHSGFEINPAKTRMQYRGSRQVTTGLLVNLKVNTRPEYYRTARAMCHALFSKGTYYKMVPASLAGGSSGDGPVKVDATSLRPLEGILSHVHQIKLKTDWGLKVSPKKSPFERTIYTRFLFYKNFVASDAPLIVSEGATDTIYLRASIKKLEKYHPTLGQFVDGKFSTNVRFLNCSDVIQSTLKLGNGTGGLANLVHNYDKTLKGFGHAPLNHPVILLIDNDDGATSVFKAVKKFATVTHKSTKPFYHLVSNLYLVKTPELKPKITSCIEDLFSRELRKSVLNGKSFDPNGSDGTYGKFVFATQVVKPNIHTIDFSAFASLLDRLVAVIKDYEMRKAKQPIKEAGKKKPAE
jgi:retron-type reverse transcriptase